MEVQEFEVGFCFQAVADFQLEVIVRMIKVSRGKLTYSWTATKGVAGVN